MKLASLPSRRQRLPAERMYPAASVGLPGTHLRPWRRCRCGHSATMSLSASCQRHTHTTRPRRPPWPPSSSSRWSSYITSEGQDCGQAEQHSGRSFKPNTLKYRPRPAHLHSVIVQTSDGGTCHSLKCCGRGIVQAWTCRQWKGCPSGKHMILCAGSCSSDLGTTGD